MQGRRLHLARLHNTDEYPFQILQIPPSPSPPLHVTGRPSTEYVSDETPMSAYANLHFAFEQMRVRALRDLHGSPSSDDDQHPNSQPPRVLILGPENSGKTSISKILSNYALRVAQNWSPLLVNLDPAQVCPLFSPPLSLTPLPRARGLSQVQSLPPSSEAPSEQPPLLILWVPRQHRLLLPSLLMHSSH